MDGIPYAVRATNGKRAVSPGAICRSVTARITSDTAPLSAVLLPTVAAPEAASTTRTLLHATMHPMTLTLRWRVFSPSYTEPDADVQIQSSAATQARLPGPPRPLMPPTGRVVTGLPLHCP